MPHVVLGMGGVAENMIASHPLKDEEPLRSIPVITGEFFWRKK